MSERDDPPMYQALRDIPECGIRRGDTLELAPDRWWIVREVRGLLPRQRLFEHLEEQPDAFRPLGDTPPLRSLLGIRRPPARKRASKPTLTLLR